MRKLLAGINWRQICLHILATLLIVIGFRQFVFLSDPELTTLLSRSNEIPNIENAAERISLMLTYLALCNILVLLVSGLIIYILTRGFNRFWSNLLITIILAFIIIRIGTLNLHFIKLTTLFVGRLFEGLGFGYSYVINGFVLTAIGLYLFFSRRTRQLVQNR